MTDFILLKRTYPVSKHERICDGYEYILNHSTIEERNEWGVNIDKLQRRIVAGEKYIYRVAKEGKIFKISNLCFTNYGIIRKNIYKLKD